MTWTRHKDIDGTTSWNKTIGGMNVTVANMERRYKSLPTPGRGFVYVWVSGYPESSGRSLVWRDWTVKDAKAWAERTYS